VSQDACPWLPGFIRELIAGVGVTTVSGGALGVDSLVHAASLDVGIPTVVVVAGGLRHLGPRSNEALFRRVIERGGCIVSDKPLDRRPDAFHFVARNRVIAALSAATVVVRAPEESGALATAAYARRMGRPVLAVPGDPTDAQAFGCHRLIREGAGLCCGPSDVSDALGLRGVSSSQLSFGLTEESVPELGLQGGDEGGIQALLVETLGRGALSVDELCERTGQRADLVLSALTELELLGSVSMAGGLVCLPRRLFAGTRRSR
jgi:DNA processing protein